MKISEIVFSPTGGTQKVADIIANDLDSSFNKIDLTDRNYDFSTISFDSEDTAVIAMPSFGGRIPQIAAKRLLDIKGNGAKAVLVCVYGNRDYDDTLVEMEDIAANCGFNVIAAVSAVAKHSILHQFASDRPDAADIDELKSIAKEIKNKIHSNNNSKPVIPGNRPYKSLGGSSLNPNTSDACVSCGICAENCPVGAIDENDFSNIDSKICIGCMRCVEKCPVSAKSINSQILDAVAMRIKDVCSIRKNNKLFI